MHELRGSTRSLRHIAEFLERHPDAPQKGNPDRNPKLRPRHNPVVKKYSAKSSFLRFGHSDGGAGVAAKEAASPGFEYTTQPNQVWSLGFGWANPAASDKGDEYVVETSYKFRLLKGFSLLPKLQLLLDPANNLEEDQVWVFGLRVILAI